MTFATKAATTGSHHSSHAMLGRLTPLHGPWRNCAMRSQQMLRICAHATVKRGSASPCPIVARKARKNQTHTADVIAQTLQRRETTMRMTYQRGMMTEKVRRIIQMESLNGSEGEEP